MSEEKRISPDEFKGETRRKGWSNRALALRWGVSETWVSKVGSNPNRNPYWDDALRGLPFFKDVKHSSK